MSSYRIIKTIYEGYDGPVFLVEDKSTKRHIVLKRYEWESNREGVDPDLLIECTLLNYVKGHPNLLQLHRIESHQYNNDIFVERMDGEMKKLIQFEPNVHQIKSIMSQILNGLVFLHSNGIIHNDIKPKNILYIDKYKNKIKQEIIETNNDENVQEYSVDDDDKLSNNKAKDPKRKKADTVGKLGKTGKLGRTGKINKSGKDGKDGKSASENKMINDPDRYKIKIIDLGLARLVNYPYYRIRNIQTTHHYTPPEYMDHREIGRISFNSDIFSLGVVFYYLLNPGTRYTSGYKQSDLRNDYDYIFDVNIVNWTAVREVAGKDGEDLLKRMLEFNPEERISSIGAFNHPFLKKVSSKIKQYGGSGAMRQYGGSRHKTWEITNLASRKEYLHPRNHEEFLNPIIAKCKKTSVMGRTGDKSNEIPIRLWNYMYKIVQDFDLKFITLNYAIYLFLSYINEISVKSDDLDALAYAAIFLSSKLNEYEHEISRKHFSSKVVEKQIINFERKIVELFNWALPLPIMVTKEVIMYDMYMSIIYGKSTLIKLRDSIDRVDHFYNHYYLLELISSLTYFSPELSNVNKVELAKVILSYKFVNIKHSPKLRKVLDDFILSKQSLYWVGRDLISYLNIK
jgi:serine/threonine protein kinase